MIDKKWGRKLKRKKSRPISLKSVSEKFKGPDLENTLEREKCLVDRKLKRPRKRKRAIKKECHLNLKKCTISIKVSRYWSSKTLTWIKKKWHLAFDRKWGGWLSFLRGFLELFKGGFWFLSGRCYPDLKTGLELFEELWVGLIFKNRSQKFKGRAKKQKSESWSWKNAPRSKNNLDQKACLDLFRNNQLGLKSLLWSSKKLHQDKKSLPTIETILIKNHLNLDVSHSTPLFILKIKDFDFTPTF